MTEPVVANDVAVLESVSEGVLYRCESASDAALLFSQFFATELQSLKPQRKAAVMLQVAGHIFKDVEEIMRVQTLDSNTRLKVEDYTLKVVNDGRVMRVYIECATSDLLVVFRKL